MLDDLAPPKPGTPALGPDAGRFEARTVTAVLRPGSVDEVAAIVAETASRGGRLHPTSTGFNWGLGSRAPLADDVTILDMSAMNAIRAIDTRAGYAIVEPGVTQGELALRLADTERTVNLTGASQHTGIVGNLLERGVGLHRQRTGDLAGLEVVLPDGTRERTGWWPNAPHPTAVYPPGVGPSFDHLFTQSDLGIVTAAVIRLPARPEAVRVLPLTFPAESLAEAVTTLSHWTAQRLIPPNTKIYNTVAARAYGVNDRYLAHVALSGATPVVDALTDLVLRETPGTTLTLAPDSAADQYVHRAYAGLPDPDDTLFLRKVGCPATDVDHARGLLLFLPIVPFQGTAAARAARLVQQSLQGRTRPPGITINTLDTDAVDHVVTLAFPPDDPEATADAHRTLDRLHETFRKAGFVPYRPDIAHPLSTANKTLHHRLKHTLDPNGVLAPNRYTPAL